MDELRTEQMEKHTDGMGEPVITPAVNTALLAKWLNALFWLIIAANIADLFTGESVTKAAPLLSLAGQIIGIAANLIYGVILLKISSESSYYRKAAIYFFIIFVVGIVWMPISDGTAMLLEIPVSIVSIVIGMAGEYYEIRGHADVLRDVDNLRSEKWYRLWRWYVGILIGIIIGTVTAIVLPLLGLLIVLASTIGMLVVTVLKIVYIYKMAKVFLRWS